MVRTLRALFVTDPFIVLSTGVMGTLSLLASLFDSSGRSQHAIARAWGRGMLRVAGIGLRVEGKLAPGACVLVSNHASYMDIPALLAGLPEQFRFMAKKSLLKVPFIGYHLKRAGHVAVERGDPRAAARSMSEAARIVRERGVPVLVFPEGGRNPVGLREFKEGAAYLAIKAGVPMVPIALVGTRQVLPMDSLLVRPGHITLRIGEPIPTAGLKIHDRDAVTSQLRERVAELIGAVQSQ